VSASGRWEEKALLLIMASVSEAGVKKVIDL
jgi:hypothetical protein